VDGNAVRSRSTNRIEYEVNADAMIAAGITKVHQKSSEFLFKLELSVVVFICLFFLLGIYLRSIAITSSNTILDVEDLDKFHNSSGAIIYIDATSADSEPNCGTKTA